MHNTEVLKYFSHHLNDQDVINCHPSADICGIKKKAFTAPSCPKYPQSWSFRSIWTDVSLQSQSIVSEVLEKEISGVQKCHCTVKEYHPSLEGSCYSKCTHVHAASVSALSAGKKKLTSFIIHFQNHWKFCTPDAFPYKRVVLKIKKGTIFGILVSSIKGTSFFFPQLSKSRSLNISSEAWSREKTCLWRERLTSRAWINQCSPYNTNITEHLYHHAAVIFGFPLA